MINTQQHLCLSTETTTCEPTTDHLTYHHPPTETMGAPTNLMDFDMAINHQESPSMSQEEELMQWHHRLCHMPMKRVQNLASKGILPKRIAKCKIPLFPACVFGKMTRSRWRTSPIENSITPDDCDVGDLVSVDQIQSSTPGMIAQMKGIPTRRRYHIATIYIDHKREYTYVHLQQSTTSEETLQSKNSCERWAKSCNITIKKYHSDNGRFADNAGMNDAANQVQIVSMCGVNAYHQNGKAERRIRQLHDMARTSSLAASTQWPDAINAHLWPYAVKKAAEDLNKIMHESKTESPYEAFTQVPITPDIQNAHPFGCPFTY
jgi:GAG-pre-integrase domain